ncbi:hypothetical protein GGE65_007413 [Skermanella aerolata]|uniref:hypothetical protein n=1 Tax=Skermanella aerolata TaxID=393310 RepID=UPI003D25D859
MYSLVPHEISTNTVNLWVAAIDDALPIEQLQLVPDMTGRTAIKYATEWPAKARMPRIRCREIEISSLVPRQMYSFALMAAGQRVAEAKVTTLPKELPLRGDKPFIVLLGSCFSHREDKEKKVGNTFFQLPHYARPDVKIFAGDQVYLDSPWQKFVAGVHTVPELHGIFFDHYKKTWGQNDGFAQLLKEGANYFCSDDHEFWNNAPNIASFIQDTWSPFGKREDWWKAARELYGVFQAGKPIQKFDVPPVSFLIADTRMNRLNKQTDFMLKSDLDAIGQWVDGLNGPGVLVIGQPLLQTSTGFFSGHLKDWNLPDYEQYHQLTEIVGRSNHSLVILTGDVHYGRIARSSLRSGAELIEIIASPMSLVDENAKGVWEPAPVVFPAVRPENATPASLARSGVTTEPSFSSNDAHFLTLEFTRQGVGALLRLRHWPIVTRGVKPRAFGKNIWERVLI